MNLGRTKSIEQSITDTEEPDHQLRKRLGAAELTVFGVGVTIGTGIFVLTGKAAGVQAGPAIALSFVFAGIACALAALCYAEFASTVPVAGSAYTFSYASLGEFVAWIIGWDLVLELALGASTVAVGWSSYFADVMKSAGVAIPSWAYGGGHNIVAAGIVLVLIGVLCLGIKISSQVNMVIVAVKVGIVLFVIVAGFFYIKASNYSPFIPPTGSAGAGGAQSTPSLLQDFGVSPGSFGITGIFTGAALVFFAFIGFDVVATAAEETKKPQRDVPIGILASLAICTTLYVAVSLVVTGMVKFTDIKVDAPLAEAFRSVGKPGFATVISVGALLGLTTVMLILLLGQSRVFFAMSRDRLLPPGFAAVSQRFGTPVRTSIATGLVVAVLSASVSLSELAELVNIGT
ncbi:MAG TPA: amino acid permease, partial [Pseudonocardiaceae bacterium]|nr:amino acid permease [Pseudonocardiaceae bacterium]